MAKKSISEAVSNQMQTGFDLEGFKSKKLLSGNVKFKEQNWLPLSEAFGTELSVPGIPLGHVTLLRGHSDTGKTTALLEAAASAQRRKILPVFIITEMKWSWPHAIESGIQVEEVINEETGEVVDYKGFFIYADRETLNSIEEVAAFILDLMDEQKKGQLPYDLLFLWDSIGSVPCELSIRSNKNNNEWNAGAMSTQFTNNVNQRITMSRKESSPYTNSLVCINKVWTQKPESPMGRPKMMNKGGFAMWYDATFIITFGNISNAGTSKLKAVREGKHVEFGKIVNVQIEKNHVTPVQSKGKLVMTSHGFLRNDKKEIDNYKKEHTKAWSVILGGTDFKTVEEQDETSTNTGEFKEEPN